jgi:hypothetical protein
MESQSVAASEQVPQQVAQQTMLARSFVKEATALVSRSLALEPAAATTAAAAQTPETTMLRCQLYTEALGALQSGLAFANGASAGRSAHDGPDGAGGYSNFCGPFAARIADAIAVLQVRRAQLSVSSRIPSTVPMASPQPPSAPQRLSGGGAADQHHPRRRRRQHAPAPASGPRNEPSSSASSSREGGRESDASAIVGHARIRRMLREAVTLPQVG